MAKYKVGDRVRIVSEMPCDSDFALDMRRFLGKEITISMAKEWDGVPRYYSEDVKPKGLIVESLFAALGVPGYYFRENWISGLADPEKPADEDLSVTIHFHGRLTVAELYKNGKVVKAENARCNPKDEYSRSEGARIAVERLLQKKAEASKPKIGDKFVIMWNGRPDCIHHFRIGSVVTLKYTGIGENIYEADDGLKQIVRDRDVAPYREKTK